MASGRATATLQADSAQCPAPGRRPASGHCSHTRGASCPEGIPIRCKLSCARATPSPGNWQPTRMPSTARRSGSRPEPLHAVTRRIQPMPGWGGAQVNRFRPAARLWGTLENPELGLRPFEHSCVVPERNCHADSRMQLADQPRRHGTRYCSAAFNIRQSIRTGRVAILNVRKKSPFGCKPSGNKCPARCSTPTCSNSHDWKAPASSPALSFTSSFILRALSERQSERRRREGLRVRIALRRVNPLAVQWLAST